MSRDPSYPGFQWGLPGSLPSYGGMPQGMAFPGFGNTTVVDKVPPEMLHLVDAHWYQFPPMNPLWHAILGFVIGVLGVISVIGNFVVIYVFMTTRSLKTPSNLIVVNLAFSDFLMMATMFPPMVINCYNETWAFGPLMCELYGMAGSLFGCASIWSLAVIALDRYNVIVKGMAAKPMTYKRALGYILFVWFFSVLWTVLPMVGWNRYVPEGNMTACGTDYLTETWLSKSYLIVYSFWVYFLPLFLIIFCYFYIVQIALMTISLWFIAWTPYLVINWNGMFNKSRVTPLFTIWGSVFAKAAAVYNPIIYGISHPKYRAALRKKLPCLACASDDGDQEDTKSVTTVTTASSERIDEKPSA
ncbi:unnamed protein product [Darwinula stevensoni]|uniref:G-protein coupled receptors family 1 profile domain-containing protein n=1 Tax=Darwinula stevensoni TaxID=69355 RepID=A0A7R9A8Q5_9CRUS|nr:unnamed protein product [Darwinula stevensoni]CAG0896623.1 unnamed protein product [Darwinula stevensoni]